jgi:transposase
MIRLFTILYKIDFKEVPSGIELYNTVKSQFNPLAAPCPSCDSRGQLDPHDNYSRYLIDYDNGARENIIDVRRVKCGECGHTHAALPDVLAPHKSYCIIFILRVLKEYFHTRAVTAICKKYGIAPSTLYDWRDRYLTHAALDLGAIVEAALLSVARWIANAAGICLTDAPHDFFKRFGFSFMQYKKTSIFSSA